MTEEQRHFFRVGLLLLGGILGLIGLILFFSGTRFGRQALAESYFSESVQGLEVGARVSYRGVAIGRVTQIGLARAEYGLKRPFDLQEPASRLVVVRYSINITRVGGQPDPENAVKLGLRARLASQGLTGLTYIELDFYDPQQFPPHSVPWKPKSYYIPSVPSTIAQVQDAIQTFLGNLAEVDIVGLSKELEEVLGDIRVTLEKGDLHTTLLQASETLKTVQTELQRADLPTLSKELQASAESVRGFAQGPQTKVILAKTAEATSRLSVAVERLPGLIAALSRAAQRADASAADLEQELAPTLRDIRAAAENLRDTSEMLRQSPGQVLFGAPPPRRPGQP
ncbi:MAG: MCE family protein [Acetobacteraceae bacterium]|nr:MCE family protein [Acetobacteraceae bacterium]